MNLNTKQINALTRELLPQIKESQKKQLASLEDELKKRITNMVNNLNIDFSIIDDLVYSIYIDTWKLWERLWFQPKYVYKSEFKSNQGIVDYTYSHMVKTEFEARFWKEITSDEIKHEIILSTIWAENIEQLINAVKLKLMK